MGKRVTTIPATISKFTASPLTAQKKRKVAAYARVSTDHEEQQSSYEAQVDYYTSYIKGRSDWEFVAVYADEGITGCNTTHRDGFNSIGGQDRPDHHQVGQPLRTEHRGQSYHHPQAEGAWHGVLF